MGLRCRCAVALLLVACCLLHTATTVSCQGRTKTGGRKKAAGPKPAKTPKQQGTGAKTPASAGVLAPAPAPTPAPVDAPAPTTPAPQGSASKCPDISAVMDYVNQVRATHQAPPQAWSEKVAAHAQQVADKLAKAGCPLDHTPEYDYGENLYSMRDSTGPPTDACLPANQYWYIEGVNYVYTNTPLTDNWINGKYDIGHYTQVVWKASTQIGCGQALGVYYADPTYQCRVVVCNYNPFGNAGEDPNWKANVLPAV